MADWNVHDVAAGVLCRKCGNQLGNSPSDDFCSDECQTAWYTALVNPMARPYDEVMAEAHKHELDDGQWWAAGKRPAA
jgi:hypothetical protein